MAGVGRKPNASMSPGPIDASACPSDLVWNKHVNALIASSFISRRPRRLCQPEGCATQTRRQDR
jgi:hypothetical protein